MARDRAPVEAPRDPPLGAAGEADGVQYALGRRGRTRRSLPELPAGLGRHEEVAGQVAAVHRGDVPGLEGNQGPIVVPVVEVATVALHSLQRAQRPLEPLGRLHGADPPEVPSGHHREEVDAHVGGRGPVRQPGLGVLLEVVGREPARRLGDRLLEEAPALPGGPPDLEDLLRAQLLGLLGPDRPAHPPGQEGGRPPGGHQREGRGQGARAQESHRSQGRPRHRHRAPTPPVGADDASAQSSSRQRRRRPLQEVAPGHVDADHRPDHGVHHQPGVVRQEGHLQPHAGEGVPRLPGRPADVGPERRAPPPRHQAAHDRHDRRHGHRGHHEGRPQARGDREEEPPGQQQQEGGRGGEGPPQVVHHLPPAREGRRGGHVPPLHLGSPPQDPREELPVAPGPPVQPAGVALVVRREVVEQLHVADEAAAGEGPLEVVVAEERPVGGPPVQRRLEGVHVVDPLPHEGAPAEEVLVDVRGGRGVGVDAGGAGVEAVVERALAGRGQQGRHPGLEDPVAVGHPPQLLVVAGAVQGVRQGAHQPPGRAGRQAGVGVQGEHEADVGRHVGEAVVAEQVGRRLVAPEQAVQLLELPPLPLPAHPPLLGLAPHPPAVEEQEAAPAVRGRTVALVQLRHGLGRGLQQGLVPRPRLLGGVPPVAQEGEGEVSAGVRQVALLEPLHLLPDPLLALQERGDGHQRPVLRRHALLQLQLREPPRGHDLGHVLVEHRDGEVGGRHQGEYADDHQRPGRRPDAGRVGQREDQQDAAEQGQRPEVAGAGRGQERALEPAGEGDAVPQVLLERPAPLLHQVVAQVAGPGLPGTVGSVGGAVPARPLHAADRPARHLLLVGVRAPRQLLHGVAVAVPGGEVRLGIDPRGVPPEDPLHQADVLEELRPAEGGDLPHAGDDVRHRRLGRELARVLLPDQLLHRRRGAAGALLQPVEDRHGPGILVPQPLHQLHHEGAVHARGAAVVGPEGLQRVVSLPDGVAHGLGDAVGLGPGLPGPDDPLGQAAQVLHQGQAEGAGHGPHLADGEAGDLLVGVHERLQRLRVEPAVRVSHVLPGEGVDPRVARQLAADQLGELALVALGQGFPGLPHLLLDDVEVVQEPLGGRGDGLVAPDRGGEVAVGVAEDPLAVVQPVQDPGAQPLPSVQPVLAGEPPGVEPEALRPEDLAADGLGRDPVASARRSPSEDAPEGFGRPQPGHTGARRRIRGRRGAGRERGDRRRRNGECTRCMV